MATVKSLEDMLSSEYDESVVNALVGSLESQLASSNAHVASQELSSVAVSANHVNNATHVDGNVMRLLDGQKLDISTVVNPVGEISKSQPLATQPTDMNCTVTTSNSTSVMVTLPGALPASGYITQVTGPPQQSLFTPSVAAGIVTSRSLTVHNQDVKIVYSSPSPVSHLNTVTSSNNSVFPQRNNLKIASLPNGSPNPVGIIAIRANQPLVTVAAVNPIIAGSTTSMSAIHDLANIASQQTPIVIPNTCQPVGTTTLQGITPHPAQIQVNAANGKQVITARIQNREQVNSKINDKNTKQTLHTQDVLSTANTPIQNTAITQVNSNILQVNNPSVVSKSHNQGNQPVGIVSNSSSILSGVQIVNVNPAKITTPAVSGQRALAPRVVLSNPLRLTANPQILTTRPAGVQVAGQNTITLPHGMVRGAILVKTENGQFQVVNVAQSLPASSSASPITSAPTYRLQSVQQGTQVVRTMSQPMAVTVPVSVTSSTAKTTQQASVTAPQTIVGTLLQQGPQLSEVSSRLSNSIISSTPGTQVQQSVVAKVTGVNGNLTSPLTVQTTTSNSQSANAPSQMSPNTAKRKCKNFLSTLIRLAEEQPASVAKSVRNLIQGIIDGTIPAEEFTAKLQKELHSAPQPYLVPFLKKNLPYLRHSLFIKELTIEGIRPPPTSAIIIPPAITSLQQIQVGPKKTGSSQQTATQLRLMSPASGGALTAQLLQASPSIMAQRFPRIPAALVNQGKSLLVATSGNKSSTGVSAAALSPATVGILQAKSSASMKVPSITAKDTAKRNFNSSLRDDDDINDVAAMGGVNLVEESQRILASNADIVGTQIRSCKDESFLCTPALQRRISAIAARLSVEEIAPDVMSLIAHAAQERLKSVIEKLGIIAEHRIENAKSDSRYEITQDVKYQLKFLEELDRLEKRRHEEQEREVLLRAAKSRSKLEDPEQLKLKQKAKEMQRAEMEEMRQREANATALLAIGPRKKLKLDSVTAGVTAAGSNDPPGFNSNVPKVTSRPRVKRVNLRDFLFLMEQERDLVRTPTLYKAYVK